MNLLESEDSMLLRDSLHLAHSIFFSNKSKPLLLKFNKINSKIEDIDIEFKDLSVELNVNKISIHSYANYTEV